MFFKRILKPVFAPAISAAIPVSSQHHMRDKEIDILARTLWGEARGESLQGKEAVANVIMNRLHHAQRRGTFWWGNDLIGICQKPFQFSCWNKDDPNYQKIQNITTSDAQFAICRRIATRAINGILPDHTHGADHYHADYVSPKWAKTNAITATIGRHIFYRLER